MTLSPRNQKALAAVSRLPIGDDGWRRAAFRNQLHEDAGLSRGAMQRAIAELVAGGLVEVQKVGRSARLPEGYRLTAAGEGGLAHVSQHEPAVSQFVGQPRASLSSGSMSFSENEKREPKTEELARGPAGMSQPGEPAPLRLGFDQQTLAVHYAAMTQTPLCGCMLPMHGQQQRKSGLWFWRCMHGKKGCGITAPMRYQPKGASGGRGPRTIADDEAKRRGDFSGLTGTAWLALNAASRSVGEPKRERTA